MDAIDRYNDVRDREIQEAGEREARSMTTAARYGTLAARLAQESVASTTSSADRRRTASMAAHYARRAAHFAA